jgi:hypothetical protein
MQPGSRLFRQLFCSYSSMTREHEDSAVVTLLKQAEAHYTGEEDTQK